MQDDNARGVHPRGHLLLGLRGDESHAEGGQHGGSGNEPSEGCGQDAPHPGEVPLAAGQGLRQGGRSGEG